MCSTYSGLGGLAEGSQQTNDIVELPGMHA